MLTSLLKLQRKASGRSLPNWLLHALPLAACSFFFVAGLAFLPLLGVEDDEALFGVVFYEPHGGGYQYHLGRLHIPLMILPYLGTLKSWLYRPISATFGTTIEAIRIPALLAGAASLWVFYWFLIKIAGYRAAAIGVGLLAVDSMYLLTTCFDWGPVALQHLLLWSGLLLLVSFWHRRDQWRLAAGFFLFGLLLWDKALAFWTLGGVGVAALVTIRRQMSGILTARRLTVVAAAFAFGALPLILYNIHTRGGTLRGNAVYDGNDVRGKTKALLRTFGGSGLYGWMQAADPSEERTAPPEVAGVEASAALAGALGHPAQGWLFYAFCAALLLAPLAQGAARSAILFAAIALAVAWAQMLFTAAAGGSVHHIILLWPLPQMVIGVSFAAASRRLGRWGTPVLATLVVLIMGSNLAVLNENYLRMARNGGAISWSDAVFPLSDYLQGKKAHYIFCLDWGYLNALRLLSNNALPVRVGSTEIGKPELSDEDRRLITAMISEPGGLFVTHTANFEFMPGISAKLVRFAEGAGYRREMLATVRDSYGRPTYEVYRFAPNRHL